MPDFCTACLYHFINSINVHGFAIDATTPYMYHCHILEHEDRGMMGQFVVV
jgi:FtsP/CotA-like multicopper oxidase with cupredoxin domain